MNLHGLGRKLSARRIKGARIVLNKLLLLSRRVNETKSMQYVYVYILKRNLSIALRHITHLYVYYRQPVICLSSYLLELVMVGLNIGRFNALYSGQKNFCIQKIALNTCEFFRIACAKNCNSKFKMIVVKSK